MKENIIGILLVLTVFIFSCEKEELSGGIATAEFNGMPWQGVANVGIAGLYSDRVSMAIKVFEDGITKEAMSFRFLPKEIGDYSQDFIATDSLVRFYYSTLGFDGDALKDIYNLDEANQSNFISIDELTETEIKGKFELTFLIDTIRMKIDPSAPDTIHFTNGKFHSKIN